MNKNDITQSVIDRYLAGEASQEERLLVESWYNSLARQKEIDVYPTDLSERMNKALPAIMAQPQIRKRKSMRKLWWSLSAAALLVCILGVYLLFKTSIIDHRSVIADQSEVSPGGNVAYLTLSNGRRIAVGDMGEGETVADSEVLIRMQQDGQLIYEHVAHDQHEPGHTNLLETPNGGQYQIILPDGSRVWLNAASSLRYPTSFNGVPTREVELTGEAYFEVKKDATMPFIVKLKGQRVEVLGTAFNINTYSLRDARTTLLEGSVRLTATSLSKSHVLRPGQQSRWDGDELRLADVDVDEAIAWKNGYFNFNSKTLEKAMDEIARWYDVQISYNNTALKNVRLAGTISRYDQLETVLKSLELTGSFTFQVQGRSVVVGGNKTN